MDCSTPDGYFQPHATTIKRTAASLLASVLSSCFNSPSSCFAVHNGCVRKFREGTGCPPRSSLFSSHCWRSPPCQKPPRPRSSLPSPSAALARTRPPSWATQAPFCKYLGRATMFHALNARHLRPIRDQLAANAASGIRTLRAASTCLSSATNTLKGLDAHAQHPLYQVRVLNECHCAE